ncbi:hypothetical protein BBJ28_00003659 [Nothophytophthora sp. Chile5]|nr:hypothetical protein BBJ28_00003659 [Nothophytophthora sp. Chile5]
MIATSVEQPAETVADDMEPSALYEIVLTEPLTPSSSEGVVQAVLDLAIGMDDAATTEGAEEEEMRVESLAESAKDTAEILEIVEDDANAKAEETAEATQTSEVGVPLPTLPIADDRSTGNQIDDTKGDAADECLAPLDLNAQEVSEEYVEVEAELEDVEPTSEASEAETTDLASGNSGDSSMVKEEGIEGNGVQTEGRQDPVVGELEEEQQELNSAVDSDFMTADPDESDAGGDLSSSLPTINASDTADAGQEHDVVKESISPEGRTDSQAGDGMVDGEATVSMASVLPPPAPVVVPAFSGSMNPTDDDNDNDDSDEDSQSEEEADLPGDAPLPPPLRLGDPDDDDEDELEIDTAVVSSLQIEEKQRGLKTEDALLKALPGSKTDGADAIEISFTEEVRVAHVTTPEPSDTFSHLHKVAGGSGKGSNDSGFGISYQSTRKKHEEPVDGGDTHSGGYSLPSGPAFPDEREFEKEVELASDLAFSVATDSEVGIDNSMAAADDDEFSFDVQPIADSIELSEDALRERRESFEAQKRKEEQELVDELKRATDEEKRLIESSQTVSTSRPDSTANAASESGGEVAVSDALSLTELHSMYKRGLGDQEVLMDDNEKEAQKLPTNGEAAATERSLSLMGRILSKPYGLTTTIAEEGDEEAEAESDDNQKDIETVKGQVEDLAASNDASRENGGDVETPKLPSSEWMEIKLVQHDAKNSPDRGQIASIVGGSNAETASVSRISYTEAAGYYAETAEVMQQKDKIVPEDFPRGSCFGCLSRPRLTFAGAIQERDRVFCIAATGFDAQNDVVTRTLQSIYRKLIANPRDVSLIGRHWEDVGFQGTDPSTDLRGCGVLSLLQMLYLVETHPELARRLHVLSQHPTRHFPFACALINATLQCVVALRSGALYSECNQHASVLSGMNRVRLLLPPFDIGDDRELTVPCCSRSEEIPLIMKDVLDRGRIHPGKVIDEVFDGTALRSPLSDASVTPQTKGVARHPSANNVEFTEIALHAIDDD